jgi:hypothetical protein
MASPVTCIWSGGASDNAFAVAGNWAPSAPVSTDSAIFPALAAAATKDVAGSDQSAILLVNTVVEAGCYVNFGSRVTALHLDTDYLVYEGSGSAHLDIDNSTEVRVYKAPSTASDGGLGVNLSGDANALLIVDANNGTVGVAFGATQVAAFTTIQVASGKVFLGAGVTNTTFHQTGGTVENNSAVVTVNLSGGTYTQEQGTVTNLNIRGGRYYANSTGTITACVVYGGVLDLSKDARAKTITTLTIHPGGSIYDPNKCLTTTNAIVWAKGGTLSLT